MRTALILLLLLGVVAIPGSLFPQRTQNPMKVREYFANDPSGAQWMDRFWLFDVYGSPWFSAIYLLLFISLIGCVLPRTWEHARAIGAKPPLTPKYLGRMEFYNEVNRSESGALDRAELWFKKNRFRMRRDKESISAEKGYARESGNLLFHLSLIVVLIGISLSSVEGARGMAIVNVGERFINIPTSYDSFAAGRFFNIRDLPPFSLEVTAFKAEYDPATSAPLDFTLTVNAAQMVGEESIERIIKVNHPLTFGSTRVYLQATGYSPVVTVKDATGRITFEGPVAFLPQDANLASIGAIKVPDMEPQIGFVASFLPTAKRDAKRGAFSSFPEPLDPKLLLSVWQGDLGMDSGTPQSVYKLDSTKMVRIGLKALAIGESYEFAKAGVSVINPSDEFAKAGSITFDGFTPWVNIEIVRDPGKGYALAGSVFAILGLLISLFTRRRRIWIKDSSIVEIAGLSKNDIPGLEQEIQSLKKWLLAGPDNGDNK